MNASVNPLEWWALNGSIYPKLARIAQAVLAIPATTAASDREFSKARIVMPWFRCRLASDTLQALMCPRDWLCLDVTAVDEVDNDLQE